jgi:hypothetical protein
MRSIRLSAVAVVIVITLSLAGCGYSIPPAGWPAGTELIAQAAGARGARAIVPRDPQDEIARSAVVMLANQTPVVVVEDPLFPARNANASRLQTPRAFVRVAIAKGDRQGMEVLVPRRQLAPKPEPASWAVTFLPLAVLFLCATAVAFWLLETSVLFLLRIRSRGPMHQLASACGQRLGPNVWRRGSRPRLIERTDDDCERWREWIASRTRLRKALCARLRLQRTKDVSRLPGGDWSRMSGNA